MMEHKLGNRLLAALPPAEFDLLAPHFRKVTLERGSILVRSGDRVEQIYFPRSGAISFMQDMPDGQTVATAMMGNEGAVGILLALGPSRSPITAVVHSPGTALQISPARFFSTFSHSPALRHAVQMHTIALMVQFQHVAACNALHSVESRLARWLLHIHDRVHHNQLPLTQEVLSELIGARRPTVTQAVCKLRKSGAIRSNQRGLIEIDRPMLEASTCNCYGVMRREIDRILSPEAMKSRWAAQPAHKTARPPERPHAPADEKTGYSRPQGVPGHRPRGH
ncbi:Crp/Fnr family transcriptional regulator [Bradyrhizobium sp. SYSU BS000235]|uniref:Crp/Fnr family transcriptional regulator n=1 Tax=Bradyrhizobium sp. SYSU BS000235 TaxID=3411332 RepID=UPI003C78D696